MSLICICFFRGKREKNPYPCYLFEWSTGNVTFFDVCSRFSKTKDHISFPMIINMCSFNSMIIFPYCYTCIIRTRSFWSTNKLKFIWLFVHLISCVIEFSEFLGYLFYLFFNFIRSLLSKSKLCWENPVALIQKTIQKSEEKNYPCIRIIWYYIILKFRNLKETDGPHISPE